MEVGRLGEAEAYVVAYAGMGTIVVESAAEGTAV